MEAWGARHAARGGHLGPCPGSRVQLLLLPQLPCDSAAPAADAHHSDVQQGCPDQHLCSGTVSLFLCPPTLCCHTSVPICPPMMTPLPAFIVPTPRVSLLPPRSFFVPWLSSSCPVSVPFKVSRKLDLTTTSLTEVSGKGREGLHLHREQVGAWGLSPRAVGVEGGPTSAV